jgi:hypothetical protein
MDPWSSHNCINNAMLCVNGKFGPLAASAAFSAFSATWRVDAHDRVWH